MAHRRAIRDMNSRLSSPETKCLQDADLIGSMRHRAATVNPIPRLNAKHMASVIILMKKLFPASVP